MREKQDLIDELSDRNGKLERDCALLKQQAGRRGEGLPEASQGGLRNSGTFLGEKPQHPSITISPGLLRLFLAKPANETGWPSWEDQFTPDEQQLWCRRSWTHPGYDALERETRNYPMKLAPIPCWQTCWEAMEPNASAPHATSPACLATDAPPPTLGGAAGPRCARRRAQRGPAAPPSVGGGASVARHAGLVACGALALGSIASQHVCQHGIGASFIG